MPREQIHSFERNYSFDPASVIEIISQNTELGLALVQLPINIANAIIHKYTELKWNDLPTSPGYYWVKMNGLVSIKEYSSKEIELIIDTSHISDCKFAGPLLPPK